MKKHAFCIWENKGADQLLSLHTVDKHSLYFLNNKFQAYNHLLWLKVWFVPDMVGNPSQVSSDAAHIILPEDRWSCKRSPDILA